MYSKPSILPSEEVLLAFPVTYRLRYPLDITPQKRAAYLTDKRLILESQGVFHYLPYEWLAGLRIGGWNHSTKYVEFVHGEKIRFSTHYGESHPAENKKTQRIYYWLRELHDNTKPRGRVLADIKAHRKKFEDTTHIFEIASSNL
jgi:hypothetical protein